MNTRRGRRLFSMGAAALTALCLAGCCASPWSRFPMSSPPDRSCRSGSPAGYDLYIWNCVGDVRTVIYQYSGEMSCQEPQKETAACGALTPIEQKLGDAAGPSCPSVPESIRWPK